MSDEYIKREDALDIVAHNNVHGEITLNRYDKIIDGIYEIPSADVAPVRHGHWIHVDDVRDLSGMYRGAVWKCSECGYSFERLIGCGISMEMCHDCGARMDEYDDIH